MKNITLGFALLAAANSVAAADYFSCPEPGFGSFRTPLLRFERGLSLHTSDPESMYGNKDLCESSKDEPRKCKFQGDTVRLERSSLFSIHVIVFDGRNGKAYQEHKSESSGKVVDTWEYSCTRVNTSTLNPQSREYFESLSGHKISAADRLRVGQSVQSASHQNAAPSVLALEKVWGAYAHMADRGGWWREARGAFWHYAWDGVGQHLLLRQYDKSGKEFFSTGFRIKDGEVLTDAGHRGPLPVPLDRYHWGDMVLTADLGRMSSAYEHGGRAYRYSWVRSSKAEFEGAVNASKASAPGNISAPVSTPAKQAHDSSPLALFYIGPERTELPLGLGREFSITPGMVLQPRQDMFSQYYFFMGLRGRAGERYRVSWRGSVPVSLEYQSGRAYEVEYPAGQTVFETSKTITITLKSDAEHTLVFDQIGKQYPKDNSGGLAGPTMSGGTHRAFQPILMTVTKL